MRARKGSPLRSRPGPSYAPDSFSPWMNLPQKAPWSTMRTDYGGISPNSLSGFESHRLLATCVLKSPTQSLHDNRRLILNSESPFLLPKGMKRGYLLSTYYMPSMAKTSSHFIITSCAGQVSLLQLYVLPPRPTLLLGTRLQEAGNRT